MAASTYSSGVKLERYSPVTQSATCNRCGSTSVAWEISRKGTRYLVEIFQIEDEDVASKSDFHSKYCTKGSAAGRVKHNVRQGEIDEAVAAAWADDSDSPEPANSDEEIKTDGHPYCCSTCGAGIIDGLDDLYYNYEEGGKVETKHTCATGITAIDAQRMGGTRAANKIKFAEISERMAIVLASMEDAKAAGKTPEDDSYLASLGAEYLMLRKRLYTEIPS